MDYGMQTALEHTMPRRETRFWETPDHEISNARGIAKALREAIVFEWGWMHQKRREIAQTEIGTYDRRWAVQTADEAERRLRCLLKIRREGMQG